MMTEEIVITAGIVTYNPEIERLEKNIKGIVNQVDKLFIFDNGSNNSSDIECMYKKFQGKIALIMSNENVGIATAFNRIMESSKTMNAKWVLLLDQDTICPPNMIMTYKNYISSEKVAIIAPTLIDARRAKHNIQADEAISVIKAVSSGSLINVDIFNRVGNFEDNLFIDMVDYEYCMRVRLHGYTVLQLRSVVLDQEFGNVKTSRFKNIFSMLRKITNLSMWEHFEYIPEFNPKRVEITFRNWMYCLRKYKHYSKKVKCYYQILFYGLRNYIRVGFNFAYLRAYLKGLWLGLKMEVEYYDKVPKCKIDLM